MDRIQPPADEGDADAFCRAVYPRLAATLGLHCGEPAIGEELAQEALVRVLERWPSVRDMGSPEAWTYRVGFNLAATTFRRRAAERRATAAVGRARLSPPADLADVLAVRAALATLPHRQRAAVVLRHLADLPVAQTAIVLGCAEGTVKALTSQGLDALRQRLGVQEEAESV